MHVATVVKYMRVIARERPPSEEALRMAAEARALEVRFRAKWERFTTF